MAHSGCGPNEVSQAKRSRCCPKSPAHVDANSPSAQGSKQVMAIFENCDGITLFEAFHGAADRVELQGGDDAVSQSKGGCLHSLEIEPDVTGQARLPPQLQGPCQRFIGVTEVRDVL